MIDKKTLKRIEKIKKQIKKRFPDARCVRMAEGYYIYNKDENVFDEFYIPAAPTVLEAWDRALITKRLIQNFNRTHPLRVEMADFEKKAKRIMERKIRSGRNNETNV